jgi:hypothetical protein
MKEELNTLMIIEYEQRKRVREKKMKNYFKYSILITMFLATTMAISAVFAAIPVGTTVQPVPFESNPTANSKAAAMTVVNPTGSYDGSFDFQAQIRPTATTSVSGIWYQVATFTTPVVEQFTPGWVDLKIVYDIPHGASDDLYRIEYQVAPSTAWNVLQADTTAAFTKAIRPFPQIAEPNDGVWSWADVGNIRVRVYYTRVGTTYVLAEMTMNVWEVWATVYPNPLPPSASTAISVMPPVVLGVPQNPGTSTTDNVFFVDVYLQGYTGIGAGLWGYQITIKYDTSIVTATDYWSYWPFLSEAVSGIDDVIGSVSVSFYTFAGDTVGFTGDKTPLCRIYFLVDSAGTSVLDLLDDRPDFITEIKPVGLDAFIPPLYDGFFSSPRYLSAQPPTQIDLSAPLNTNWKEYYPTLGTLYTIAGWTDNGDSVLSASDQITMADASQWHVDQVMITIHWTYKDTYTGAGAAEPVPATTELPTDPTGTAWHEIHPTYCRTFIITGWTDNGSPGFNPSDQFEITYDDTAEVVQAHLDAVSTDILVSQKPGGPVPEFPLGIGVVMALVPMIAIVYLWRLQPKKKV